MLAAWLQFTIWIQSTLASAFADPVRAQKLPSVAFLQSSFPADLSESIFTSAAEIGNFKAYTAIGDSFAAGLKAINGGHLPWCDGSNDQNCTTDNCLRNLGSYPYRFNLSSNGSFQDFRFIACAGTNTDNCNKDQVNSPAFGTPDLVSLHVGGNNNDSFGPVVANCVYRRGWGCPAALQQAENNIASIGFHYSTLFESISNKLGPVDGNTRHVFAMGYPNFYNPDLIGHCQSWQINWPSAGKDGMRQKLNTLTDSMNQQMKNATKRAGLNFHYVDTNKYFDGHRLCDDTDKVYFRYLVELPQAAQTMVSQDVAIQQAIHVQEDMFQGGVFHPNTWGHEAFQKALTDAILSL